MTVPNVGTTTFRYDPFGRRIQKSGPLGTTNYLYDGANIVEEVDGAANILARFLHGPRVDQPLAQGLSGTVSNYESDGLGSITSVTDSSETVQTTYNYDAFGNSSSTTGTLTNSLRYAGREFDQETNLYFNRARYYDPSSGRFLSEDRLWFSDTPNLFIYSLNNPARLRDPWGHQEEGADAEDAEDEIERRDRELDSLEPVVPEPAESSVNPVFARHSASDIQAVKNGACSVDRELEEAIRINEIFDRVKTGGPFKYKQDGTVFHNKEGYLPQEPDGYYHEYTVEDPSVPNRGARRLVVGNGGEFYYTDSHYLPQGGQPPFTRIK